MGADGSEIETAAVITTEPNVTVARIYDRMPVIIQPESYAQWLDVKNVEAEEVMQYLKAVSDDYFVFEPVTIERSVPSSKPKAQLDLF